jgi:hypothetical protein
MEPRVTMPSQADLFRRPDATDLPTSHHALELTALQPQSQEAHFQPLRQGRLEPATQQTACHQRQLSPNTVREAHWEIWTLMFEQSMRMPDTSDNRVAVVEAARVHGLLPVEP